MLFIEPQCKANQFTCQDGTCIPQIWQCDGNPDCDDDSDETAHCQHTVCSRWEFRCNATGRCIPQNWVCDGEGDCQDFADEHPSRGCTVTTCDKDSFKCADNSGCISKMQYCDNYTDCPDKSDEPSTCREGCLPGEYRCKSGICIAGKLKCDGKFDCIDGDDEGSFCQVEANYCMAKGWFKCANGVCINDTLVCDGENNCGDFSDEHNCSKYYSEMNDTTKSQFNFRNKRVHFHTVPVRTNLH